MPRLNRTLINLMICIGEVLVGALLLISPVGFTSSIHIILGILLAILGASKIVTYFRAVPEDTAKHGELVKRSYFCISRFILYTEMGMVYCHISCPHGYLWNYFPHKWN